MIDVLALYKLQLFSIEQWVEFPIIIIKAVVQGIRFGKYVRLVTPRLGKLLAAIESACCPDIKQTTMSMSLLLHLVLP